MPVRLLFVDCYAGTYGEDKSSTYIAGLRGAAAGLGLALDVDTLSDRDLGGDGAEYDLAVISGSHRMVGDGQLGPELAAFLLARRKPLLGICYGHQALARVWGASVRRDHHPHKGDEEISVLAPSPLFLGFPARFPMNESHHEIVVRDAALEDRFCLLAVNREEKAEAIVHRDLPLYGVQFHPERSGAGGGRLLANFLRLATPGPENG